MNEFQLNTLDDSIPYVLFFDKARAAVPEHWHSEIELVYCLKGSVKMEINEKEYILNEGEMVLINAGDLHSYYKTRSHERMVVIFAPELLGFSNAQSESRKEVLSHVGKIERHSVKWKKSHLSKAKNIMEILSKLNNSDQFIQNLEVRARLSDLISLLQEDKTKEPADKIEEEYQGPTAMLNMDSVFKYLDENYMKDITLKDVTNSIYFSVGYFTRFFKKYTGMTFMTYLTKYRIKKAKEQLMLTKKPIAKISKDVGFTSIKTFNRRFRNVVGQAPSQFRKSMLVK